MGFGSYDEGEQEQERDRDEDDGESVNKHVLDGKHNGESSVENDSAEEMMEHL